MSDDKLSVEVSAMPSFDTRQPARDYQMVELALPSDKVLQEIGRAVVRFGQLEHLLKIIHKRTGQNILLRPALELKITLGGLLTGAKDFGETIKFDGLINSAKVNPRLTSILDQLNQARGLCKTRNKYVHNGIGKNSNKKLSFLNSGEELDEAEMIRELDQASKLTEILLSEIHRKIPVAK